MEEQLGANSGKVREVSKRVAHPAVVEATGMVGNYSR